MSVISTTSLSSKTPTPEEREKAAAYRTSTRDDLLREIQDLSPEQWRFTADSCRWCIGEVVEHLAIVEERIQANVRRMPEAAPDDPARVVSQVDSLIVSAVASRTTRVNAPAFILPTGECSPTEALARFCDSRTETLQLLESAPELRGRVIQHPIMGPWDGYQWILSTGAHTARHIDQIRELKNAERFPSTAARSADSLG